MDIFKSQLATLVIISQVLVSCSSFDRTTKLEKAKTEKLNRELKDVPYDGPEMDPADDSDQAKAFEAKEMAKVQEQLSDGTRMIGSAHIQKPSDHKGKVYFLYGAEHLNLDNYYFDIPVVYNDAVKKWIKYFLNRGRGFFERYSARGGRYAPLMGKILEDNGLPRDLIFLAMAESGFQNEAKSWAKAVGPWQFMPRTGASYGLKIDWYVDERRDPIKATIAASMYLKTLYKLFGTWELAAAGYNAGENKVKRAIRRYRTESFWKISKGRYLKSETRNYVPKIMALAIIGKNLKAFGFEGIEFHEPLDFKEVEVGAGVDLYKLAGAIGVDASVIHKYNPELRRWYTPINVKEYKIRLPVDKQLAFQECCEGKSDMFLANNFQVYKIRGRSASLYDVAKKFKLTKHVDILKSLNPNVEGRLTRGSLVLLPFREGQSIRHKMYADLYEKPRRSVLRRRRYRNTINRAKRLGKLIANPSEYYVVKRGDSLWSVSRQFNVSLNTLIKSNLKLLERRQIRAGDRLVVR